MKFEFNLTFGEIVTNYLIMMGVILLAGFTGHWGLAILGLPLFLRGLIGWCPIKTILKNTRTANSRKAEMPQDHRRMAA